MSANRLGDTDGVACSHVLKWQAMNLDPEGAIYRNHFIKRKFGSPRFKHQQRTLDVLGTEFHDFVDMGLGRNLD